MVVVITGASAGVGRATVREFARHGYDIALLGRGSVGLLAAREEVERMGGRAIAIPVDVSDAAQIEQAAADIESRLGPIDVWINNAMSSVFSPALEMSSAEIARVTEVTYLGAVYGTLAALRRMQPRNRGAIIQVGSALAYRSIPLQSAYCGAKHGLRGFTDSLRSELIHDRSDVHITMVQLPALNTPQFDWVLSRLPRESQPVPPIFQPEVAARAIYWSAHHRRRELIVGFPSWKAIVASKFIPGWLDRYLAHAAYDGQMTDEPARPGPNNLWNPVEGNFGAHGRFDSRSKPRSLHLWATTHRGALALAIGGLAATIWRWSTTRSSSDRDPTALRRHVS